VTSKGTYFVAWEVGKGGNAEAVGKQMVQVIRQARGGRAMVVVCSSDEPTLGLPQMIRMSDAYYKQGFTNEDFAFPLVGYKAGEGWRDITKDEVTVVAYGPQGVDMLIKHLGAMREPPAIDKAIIIGCGVTLLLCLTGTLIVGYLHWKKLKKH